MLSKEENELLTPRGPGHADGRAAAPLLAAGAAVRRSCPSRTAHPLRVRLLGEDLVAFRDTDGRVGLAGRRTARTAAPRCSSGATRSAACAASTTAGSSTSTAAAWTCPASRRRAISRTSPADRLSLRERARRRLGVPGPNAPRRRRCPPSNGTCRQNAACPSPNGCRTATGCRRWKAASIRATSGFLHAPVTSPRRGTACTSASAYALDSAPALRRARDRVRPAASAPGASGDARLLAHHAVSDAVLHAVRTAGTRRARRAPGCRWTTRP